MKKVFAIVFVAVMMAGCGVNNSDNIDFDASKVAYKYDPDTELCFAITASRKSGEFDTTGLGFTEVPCTDKVMEKIK